MHGTMKQTLFNLYARAFTFDGEYSKAETERSSILRFLPAGQGVLYYSRKLSFAKNEKALCL